jgi:hypothetical protein
MLDADAERECETKDFLCCDAVTVVGGSKVELARAPKKEDEEETGEIKVVHSRGSVTLRCTDGREVVYGAKLLTSCEVDSIRRWVLFGPPTDEGATTASCGLIFGRSVGPCCRRIGDLLGVVRVV